MHLKQFRSQHTVTRHEQRKQLLQKIAKQQNYPDSSSESDNENYNASRHARNINPMFPNILSELDNGLNNHDDYYVDEHDNTNKLNDFQDEALDHSPPLYDACRIFTLKSVKMLINSFSLINFDKQNTINLMKGIKSIFSHPNALPTLWKSIMKLFGKVNLQLTTFLCSKCFNQCKKTTYNAKICTSGSCSLLKRTLKSNEIVNVINLDIRTQMKSIVTRNINSLPRNDHLFPPSDVILTSFYKLTVSLEQCSIITFIIHTNGVSLVRSTKQFIWPYFASFVKLPSPIREYPSNTMFLAL